MSYLKYPDSAVRLEKIGNLPSTVHLFEQEDVDAVNAAIAAKRPLLVRGEPGTGKSQLARAAAQGLGRAFVWSVVDARTEARDLQWSFDAVQRLADAQVIGVSGMGGLDEGETVAQRLDEMRYVTPGPLWWAFDWADARGRVDEEKCPKLPKDCSEDNGVVVLIDEIDKADSSVPNGLLECLGHGRFPGPGGVAVESHGCEPLVVVTTNEERSLPDAFLRRCLVRHLSLPKGEDELVKWLMKRGRAHFKESKLADEILKLAAEQLAEDRAIVQGRGLCPPGGAEYLDLLRAVAELGSDTEEQKSYLKRIGDFVLKKHPAEER